MAQFPDNANVVIIGLGGIVGASVVHHLIEKGSSCQVLQSSRGSLVHYLHVYMFH